MTDTLKTRKIGNIAENNACEFLQKKGLKLIQRNYQCVCGEIDLIMRDGEDIVFVEVRSRNNNDYSNAMESVDQYKQNKIIKTATYYLQKMQWFDKVNCRFDVIGFNNSQLEWIQNAFNADNF